jgi:signal transduction histidine kinase
MRHSNWHHLEPQRRFVFFRFAVFFMGLSFIFLVGIGIILFVVFGPHRPEPHFTGGLGLLACGIPLGFLLLAALMSGMAFRRYGTPLAEVMFAAEAVAKGDLSVRVRENNPGELGRLAHSFNRMTTELERSENQRRNLTADVAHELRNPLHIIQGNLEGMLDGVYEPSTENLTATLEEIHLLTRLVNDLQTLSLAESGHLPLHPQHLLAADLLSDVVASFSAQAAEQEIDLRVEIPENALQLELYADPDRLDQVLSNLVANALRYTPPGGHIILRASSAKAGAQLQVEDNGKGIPADDLPYIFDRFWRGDRARSRSSGAGSGLGLAIAKKLILAHGGTIQVQSQPGQGTTFTIELPLAKKDSLAN